MDGVTQSVAQALALGHDREKVWDAVTAALEPPHIGARPAQTQLQDTAAGPPSSPVDALAAALMGTGPSCGSGTSRRPFGT